MTTTEIVQKLWNLCNVLRDDGITYHQYVTELTYILFLKMAKETGAESKIPEGYRWDDLTEKDGTKLHKFYRELLLKLGTEGKNRVQQIYVNAYTNIDEPKNLKKIITDIDKLDWYSAKEEGLGWATKQEANWKGMAAATIFALVVALALLNWWGAALLAALCLIIWAASKYFSSRFGGLTGDNYGAISEFAEVVVLILAFIIAELGGASWLGSFL